MCTNCTWSFKLFCNDMDPCHLETCVPLEWCAMWGLWLEQNFFPVISIHWFISSPRSRLAGSCRRWGELWSAPLWSSCRATWSQQRSSWRYEAQPSLLCPVLFPPTGRQPLSPTWWSSLAHPVAAQPRRCPSCEWHITRRAFRGQT